MSPARKAVERAPRRPPRASQRFKRHQTNAAGIVVAHGLGRWIVMQSADRGGESGVSGASVGHQQEQEAPRAPARG